MPFALTCRSRGASVLVTGHDKHHGRHHRHPHEKHQRGVAGGPDRLRHRHVHAGHILHGHVDAEEQIGPAGKHDGRDDGDRGDPTSVFSDNGWDASYDCGSRVSLPLFNDDWRDMYTGMTVTNPSTGSNYSHYEYYHTELAGTPYPGNMTIACNANFYYNATRPSETNPALRQSTDDYIYFDAATNRMDINGQIEINGNLVMTRGGGNDKIHMTYLHVADEQDADRLAALDPLFFMFESKTRPRIQDDTA